MRGYLVMKQNSSIAEWSHWGEEDKSRVVVLAAAAVTLLNVVEIYIRYAEEGCIQDEEE